MRMGRRKIPEKSKIDSYIERVKYFKEIGR